MRDVYIIGVGMTPFGKHMDKNMKTLAAEAVNASLQHAGLTKEAIQTAVVGNAYQGIVTGQESIRRYISPFVLRDSPLIIRLSWCFCLWS